MVFGRPFKLSRIFFSSESETAEIGGGATSDDQTELLAAIEDERNGPQDERTQPPRFSADEEDNDFPPREDEPGGEEVRTDSRESEGRRETAGRNERRRGDERRNDRRGDYRRGDRRRDNRRGGDRDARFEAYGESSEAQNAEEGSDLSPADPAAVEQMVRGLVGSPKILSREEHKLSRKQIDSDALKVLYRLNRSGYLAFLVGGSVRDLLLGKQPKDFDIGTSARPDQVRSLFRNSRTIGRRFKISHVYFKGNHIIEVTTFRQGTTVTDDTPADDKGPGILQPDNVFGDPETDAFRRDLTINGLFYDVGTLSVIDYVGGVQDLRDGIIRMIGDPYVRVQEDPVRMIRAIRHSARTGFKIEEKTYDAIVKHKDLIEVCPPARVLEELLREFRSGSLFQSLKMLHQTGLLRLLVPVLADTVDNEGEAAWARLEVVLTHLDDIANAGVALSASMLFVAVLVGNLPASMFEGENDVLRVFWETDPQFSPAGDDQQSDESSEQTAEAADEAASSETDEAGASDIHELLGERVRRILRKQIDELFSKLTLSRHEREMIEIYLVNRLKMFAIARGAANPQLEGGVSMNNLMLILGLTSLQNPSAHDCFAYWQERVQSRRGDNYTGERPRGGRRRRRRRRR